MLNIKLIKTILNQIKEEAFVNPATATDAEAMGLLISRYFEWDGVEVMKVAENALEDANYHDQCAKVNEMRQAVEKELKQLASK